MNVQTFPPDNSSGIIFQIDGTVATITLNRPSVRNAIDDELRSALVAAIEQISRDDSVRAVVLTGAGTAFCAGGDVKAMKERLAAPVGEVAFNGWRRQQFTHHAMSALHALHKPTIAAVNGPATGLGCDLALCCDFIIASDVASFAMSYVLRGLIPDGGGMYYLPRRVGLSLAKQLIFTGRTVAPDEALAIGMIDRVTTSQRLLADARAWAEELSDGAPSALALSKAILNQTFELSSEQVFAMGSQAQAICYGSQDHLDSVTDFLEQRRDKA